MKTALDLAIEDIQGYKAFGEQIDIYTVLLILKKHKEEERLIIVNTFHEGANNKTENPAQPETYYGGEHYYNREFTNYV